MRLWLAVALLILAWPKSARADDLGEQAYRVGQYGFAIRAFQRAHQKHPEARRLFTIADAYHQRFLVQRGHYPRARAIAFYRRYLAAAPGGDRVEEARRAIDELGEPTADAKLIARGLEAEREKTLLAVTSNVLDAVARVDGGKPRPLPLFLTVSPGKHRVVVTAPGHRKRTRRVTLPRGKIRVANVRLEPDPAKLVLTTSIGATVHVDGVFVGVAPFEEPLELEPGKRTIQVTLNGHDAHEQVVELERGSSTDLEIDLHTTPQRVAAALLVGAGALTVTAGIVLGVGSTVLDQNALDAFEDDERKSLARDAEDWRILSGITAATGFGFFLAGGALFIFDEPDVSLELTGTGLLLRGRF